MQWCMASNNAALNGNSEGSKSVQLSDCSNDATFVAPSKKEGRCYFSLPEKSLMIWCLHNNVTIETCCHLPYKFPLFFSHYNKFLVLLLLPLPLWNIAFFISKDVFGSPENLSCLFLLKSCLRVRALFPYQSFIHLIITIRGRIEDCYHR